MPITRIIATLLLALAALAPAAARAHAIVVAADPPAGSVRAASDKPIPVLLRFNSRIDHERSRLTLIGPDGTATPVPIAPATRAEILAAQLGALPPGIYR